MPATRQLAAILFTDIAGYTAMMQRNEQSAIKMVKHHRAVLEKTVKEFEGNVIEFYGDGSLCIFNSITKAMHCAYSIQQQMQAEPPVPLRLGLHIGEVIYEDGKIMGDGVNIASRIQSLGLPGSILFSKEIFDKIRNHTEFKTVYLGRFRMKNVDEPMEVYALANDGLTIPAKEKIEGRVVDLTAKKNIKALRRWILVSAAAIVITLIVLLLPGMLKNNAVFTGSDKSIAVLPFDNISNDTLQQYFSDGITEDIITQLSKISDLKVISRTSVMEYKNNKKNIKKIAEELGVATILEGSVRREGDKVRITAQLINANTDKHIWAETYDRNASEVFAIQSEVAHQIANEMNAKLTEDENKRIEKKATNNISAYEDYLMAKRSQGDSAYRLILRALQKDSTFALAWSHLSIIYARMPLANATDRHYYISKSLDAALTAVNYGPDLSETHMILGDIVKTITLNPNLSIKELNKSIKLNPNNAEAYVYLSFALMELGKFQEAEKNLLKAKQLDPLSRVLRIGWSNYYYYSRNAEGFIANQQQGDSAGTRNAFRMSARIPYYFLKDQYDSILLYGNRRFQISQIAIAYIKTGKQDKADFILDSLSNASKNDNAAAIAIINAWMGKKQQAIEYLNLAYLLNDYALISVRVNKLFDPLRTEEGFKNLLSKMGMD